jgi:putative PIN family toxin of toxin-antitoxin system
MMRVTIDTNVFVSALNFGGLPATLLNFHTDELFTLCASKAIIGEITRVLADRFEWTEEDMDATLTPIFSRAETVDPRVSVTASRDPDDNPYFGMRA